MVKISALLSLFITGVTVSNAAPLVKRDMQSLAQAFDHIFKGMDNFTATVDSFNGDAAGMEKITVSNGAIRSAILEGADTVKASEETTFAQLINIGGPLFVLNNKISEMMESLSSKKAAITKLGPDVEKTLIQQLKDEKEASDTMVEAITNNLPMPALMGIIVKPIGRLVTAPLDATIEDWQ